MSQTGHPNHTVVPLAQKIGGHDWADCSLSRTPIMNMSSSSITCFRMASSVHANLIGVQIFGQTDCANNASCKYPESKSIESIKSIKSITMPLLVAKRSSPAVILKPKLPIMRSREKQSIAKPRRVLTCSSWLTGLSLAKKCKSQQKFWPVSLSEPARQQTPWQHAVLPSPSQVLHGMYVYCACMCICAYNNSMA